MPRNILICLTFENHSENAFQWTMDNLIQFDDHIYLITVIPKTKKQQEYFTSSYIPFSPSFAYTNAITEISNEHVLEAINHFMHDKIQIIHQKFPDLHVQPIIVKGEPCDEILNVTCKININLLVMGAKSMSKLKRAFLGSVSDYCVRYCTCPILIVKEDKQTISK